MSDNNRWIIAGIAGAFLGAWWTNEKFSRKTKSRAELEDPEFLEEVRSKITNLLDDFEGDIESEDQFRDALASFLESKAEFEIEVAPDTPHGKPDILVEDALALEIKLDPSKAEFDRLIGQCARYSREWDTWILLVDSPDSKVGDFERLLFDKGLSYLPVIVFEETNR